MGLWEYGSMGLWDWGIGGLKDLNDLRSACPPAPLPLSPAPPVRPPLCPSAPLPLCPPAPLVSSHAHRPLLRRLLADGQRGRHHPDHDWPTHSRRAGTPSGSTPPPTRCPPNESTGPRCIARRCVPMPLYRDVQWAFPRQREIENDLAAFGPDLIHVATEVSMGLSGAKAARRLGVPMVASAHTDYQKYAEWYGVPWVLGAAWLYLRWFYGRAERVFCPSRVYQDFLRSKGIERTALWTRGVDPAQFHPSFRSEEFRRRLGRRAPMTCWWPTSDAWRGRRTSGSCSTSGRRSRPGIRRATLAVVGQGPLEGLDPAAPPSAGPCHRAAAGAGAVRGLRLGGRLHLSLADRDLRQFAARGAGVGSAVDCGGHRRRAGIRPPRRERLAHPRRRSRRARSRGWTACWVTRPCGSRLREGALRTAGERRWDLVYDRLVADYGEVLEGCPAPGRLKSPGYRARRPI